MSTPAPPPSDQEVRDLFARALDKLGGSALRDLLAEAFEDRPFVRVSLPAFPQSRPTAELVARMTGHGARIGDGLTGDDMTDVLAALTRLAALEAAAPPEAPAALAQADLCAEHRDPAVRALADQARRLAHALTAARAELASLAETNRDQHARLMAYAKHTDASATAAVDYMTRLRRERDAALGRAETLARGVRLLLRKHDLPASNMQAARAWEHEHHALYAEPNAPPKDSSLGLTPAPDTFVALCLAGQRLPAEADDFIDSWHAQGEDDRPLHEALGLAPEEYARFLADPSEVDRAVARHALAAKVRAALAPLLAQTATPELLAETARILTAALP